ncbi:NADP-dependent oxidoreductase [Psychrobium sp. MM17-31]|uniref:NADP-dependent oxidoreductase n=1 Tax=Psychrobium sp. MM17-31 TaxID=2917758 RepID=UPI001EF66C36|nr:NADP-dependent oxidoreductase [Psychrobium sp. MM17-31]MCG7530892.1 NADP-dependent oxidoreductase [Psychrobium sp. MM17-31]
MSDCSIPSVYSAVEFHEFGEPDKLSYVQRETKDLASTQIRVKTLATSINPIDFKTRQGLGWAAQENADKLPMVLGYDALGEIVEIGADVSEFAIGDKVVGFVGFPLDAGCYSQYVVATSDELVKVERSYNALAALPLAGLTAYQGLFEHGKLKAGETVLISGASGGVGYLAVQLALNAGAKVIAVASKASGDKLLALGEVTLIDYSDASVFETLPAIDLWFDLIGGEPAILQLTAANELERLVTVPTVSKDFVCDSVLGKATSALGMLVKNDKQQLTKLVHAVENNELRLNIAKYMPLAQASAAHQLAESGAAGGKIVLTTN